MLKVAVIGVGSMGKNHARVYSRLPGAKLVGVADTNMEAASKVSRQFGGQPYQDYLSMLDEQNPLAVSLVVPTSLHCKLALEVIKRGIHLLVEKPLAFSVEEGQQIITAAEKAGVCLMVGQIERFNPAIIALKKYVVEGKVGRVFQLEARRQNPFLGREKDVGVAVDLAVHDLDVMRYVSGAEVVRVFAETEVGIHTSYEDLLGGVVRFDNGALGTLSVNWATPIKIRELTVIGEKGMFRVDYLTQDLFFFRSASAPRVDGGKPQVVRGMPEGSREPLQAELEAFLAAVRGEVPVAVSGQDGLRALELASALVVSGLENRVIAV